MAVECLDFFRRGRRGDGDLGSDSNWIGAGSLRLWTAKKIEVRTMIETRVEEPMLEVDGDTEDGEAYVEYDITAYPSDLTLTVIHEMWAQKDIVVPDFQRNFVWTIQQSSRLIESFLMGLPVPQVFFYVDENNRNLVIDGLQRIMSLVYYLDGFFGDETLHGRKTVFRLSGLNERSPFAKKSFEELTDAAQRRLKGSVLRSINIRQMNPKGEKTSIYHIFERLNTGGTPLTPQEIRNCVFRGELVTQLRRLNEDKNWRTILGKSTFDLHQKDVELILRILGLFSRFERYEKPMKEFLNQTMLAEQDASSAVAMRFIQAFPALCKLVVEQLGQKPFHLRGRLNASALDSVMCIVLENLNGLPADLKSRYEALKADEDYKAATYYGTSDVAVIRSRFARAAEILVDG